MTGRPIQRKRSAIRLLAAAVFFFSLFAIRAFGKESVSPQEALSLPDICILLDRNGELLRMLPDENGLYHLWVDGKEMPDLLKKAFIAVEDRRFYKHHGFDPFASLRALKDNFTQGRIVSGASTITQQLVRLLQPRQRTFKDKLLEIHRSCRLEETLSKEEILEQYLNRVPMGNNILGVELAARVYFGKSLSELIPAEVAVLAALPKAPGSFNPYGKNKDRLLQRKNWVLTRMAEEGAISESALREAQEDKAVFRRKSFSPMKAPHLIDLLIARGENVSGIHHTTIDLSLQREVEKILLSHRARLASRGVKQAAVMVVHNPTLEVLACAGSFSYSPRNLGFNNGTIARRSAGSTLKPFIYAMALENGHTVSSLLEDTLRKYWTPFGDFSPDNFDTKEYGPVTLRLALGNSLNISALKMMERLDRNLAYEWLERMNLLTDSKRGADDYGLGLVIGNAEVTLEQLVACFSMFANEGIYRPLRYLLEEKKSEGARLFSKEVAYIISDILSDPSARMITFGNFYDASFPFRVSLKTGTSTRYRDGWIVGYTPEYTVGVWTGNFEGTHTSQVSGASGAASIFKDMIYVLHGNGQPSLLRRPENVTTIEVCGISGMRPGPYCRYVTRELFIKGTEPAAVCLFHHEEDSYHELPTPYAGWVYDKDQKGLAGNYRLKGFSKDLKSVFEEDSVGESLMADLIGIRVRNHADPVAPTHAVVSRNEGSESHHSIGNGMDEEQGSSADGAVSIIYPLPYDRFVLEKNRPGQIIRLEAVSAKPVTYVDWFIDGLHYARVGPPYHTYWNLERGRHDITAVTPHKKGDSIQIIVE